MRVKNNKNVEKLINEFRQEIIDEKRTRWINSCRRRFLQSELKKYAIEVDYYVDKMREIKEEWLREVVVEVFEVKKKVAKVKSLRNELEWLDSPRQRPIDRGDIEAARHRDIVELGLLEGVKRSGQRRHIATCLWHEDSRPSLVVYPDGKGVHCFGCGMSGSAIDVVMKVKGLSFVEAVKFLL